MTLPLQGRIALVTGASSGIGEAIVTGLAAAGSTVAATARRAERLDAVVAQVEGSGGAAIALPGDIADPKFAAHVVQDVVERFGRLDILVNSAGIMPEGGVESGDLQTWRRAIDLNLMACLHTCKAVIDPMRKQGGGDIINITSTAGRRASGFFGIYSTSKMGLTALTEGLRQEVGGLGIRVCNIEPGATDTPLFENISSRRMSPRLSSSSSAYRPARMSPSF